MGLRYEIGRKITLSPIFHQKGGFGKSTAKTQRRFLSATIDDYQKLYEASKKASSYCKDAGIAVGIHSLRGVEPEIIKKVASEFPQESPFHIHISEQLKEVEDSLAYLKKRPVEWMLDNIQMSEADDQSGVSP